MGVAHEAEREELPAWSLPADAVDRIALPTEWPERVTREWAWAGATGKGVRVCVLDSGVQLDHPLVGEVQQSVAISIEGSEVVVEDEDSEGDLCGHGTACAGVVRSHPVASSSLCACSGPAIRAAEAHWWPDCAGRSTRAST